MNEIVFSIGMTLDQIEKLVILKAFAHFRQNKLQTAASLGIALRTLDNKLERYVMEEDQEKQRQANDSRQRTEHLMRARGNPPNNLGIPYSPSQDNHTSFERNFSGAPSGIRMESIVNASAKQAMPLSESKEVQGVLPGKPTPGSPKKGR